MSMFSSRLREAIALRGVTQCWLANKAETTEATISRYATSERDPSVIEVLCNISKALDVSSDYLIGITNIPSVHQSISTDQKILLDCYSRISDSDAVVLWALLDKYLTAHEREQLNSSNRKENSNAG